MGVRHIPGGGPPAWGVETRGKAAGRGRGALGVDKRRRRRASDGRRWTDDDGQTDTTDVRPPKNIKNDPWVINT